MIQFGSISMELRLWLSGWCWRDTKKWLVEPTSKELGLLVLATVGASAPVLFWKSLPLDERLQISGGLFQVSGILTVAVGLHHTRRLFEMEKLSKQIRGRLRDWWDRHPRRRARICIAGTAHIQVGGGAATAFGTTFPPRDAPIKKRVDALQDAVIAMSRSAHQARADMNVEARARSDADRAESQERQGEDEKIRTQLKEAVAGGLHLEATGVVWLFVGVVFASIPASWITSASRLIR